MTPTGSQRPRLPLALRTLLMVGLLLVLLIGLSGNGEEPGTAVLRGDVGDVERLADLLLAPDAPGTIARPPGTAPTETELALLAAAADRAPLTIGLPSDPLPVRVLPPTAPRVGRFAAVRFTAPARSRDTVVARLIGAGGVVDSVRVTPGPGRAAEGAFRIRPGVAGWTEWTVAVGPGAAATAGAWVAEAGPPRLLVVAGPPSWESRYAIRALERSGVDLALVQHLGRDNVITSGDATATWSEPSALAAYDAVLLLPGADVGAPAFAVLVEWAAGGRAVLASSEAVGGLGLGALAATSPTPVAGSSLEWTAPAEIAPLPPADVDAAVGVFESIPAAATAAARTADGRPFLVLAPVGRGRLVGLAPIESWRWVMDSGDESGHRAFWRSLVDWAAAPSADSLGVRVEPHRAPAGTTVDLRSRAEGLELRRPDGSVESPGGGAGRFVAVDTGTYELGVDTAVAAAFRAIAGDGETPADGKPPAELGRARLSLLAAASGGTVLEPDEFDGRAAGDGPGAISSAPPRPAPVPGGWPVLFFVVLVGLAIAEWAVRRLRGLA